MDREVKCMWEEEEAMRLLVKHEIWLQNRKRETERFITTIVFTVIFLHLLGLLLVNGKKK